MMENARFEVNIETGYREMSFQFDTLDEAVEFAELALEHTKPYISSDGEVKSVKVSVSMETIELEKEDNNNELAV